MHKVVFGGNGGACHYHKVLLKKRFARDVAQLGHTN